MIKSERTQTCRRVMLLVALASPGVATARAAAADGLQPAIAAVGPSASPGPGRWQASLGARTAFLRGAGYDPFSTNDAFAQVSLSVLRIVSPARAADGTGLSTALGFAWDYGSCQSTARGASSGLSLSRLALVLEQRYAPRRWGYALVRLSPGWVRGEASLGDPSIPAALTTSFSSWSIDASAGLAGRVSNEGSLIGVWLTSDVGYGWAPRQTLALTPALPPADQGKAGTTRLEDLAPRGMFVRFAVALVY